MKTKLLYLLVSLCLLPVSRQACAADPDAHASTALPEVVVTGIDNTPSAPGTLVSPSADAARKQINAYPGAVNVVPSDHFEIGRGAYLEDLLPYAPGVIIQSSQGSEDTKVSVRGSGAQDDDIIGLGVLLDGVPFNQGDGEATLYDLDLHVVKYSEVYRGADALRYGSATLGGAINFVTLTGHEVPALKTWLTAGSYGLFEEGAVSGWSSGPFDAVVSLSNHNLTGYREHSREDDQKIFLSLGYQINESAENRIYFFMGHVEKESPSSLSKEDMLSNPKQTDPESVTQNWGSQWEYIQLVDRFAVKGPEWQVQFGAYYNHRNLIERDAFDDDEKDGIDTFYSDDFGFTGSYESTRELFGQKNRFTVGYSAGFEFEPDNFYENINGQKGALIGADKTFAANVGVYVENQHYITRQFSILTGLQGAYVQRNYHDLLDLPADGDQTTHERYFAFNPKVGVNYEWNDDTSAYLNVSRSFQPPSFDQSLETADDGNRLFNQLYSQKAITIEAGTRGKSGPFSWDVALYHSWVRDELLDLTNGNGIQLGTVNAPKTYHQGIEAGLEFDVARGVFFHGSGKNAESDRFVLEQTYNLSDFHFDNDPTYGGNRIAGTPVQFYKAELRYEHPCGFYCGPTLEWNITKYPVDEANTLYADPYALLGFRIGYKSKKGLEIYFEAKNLTNKIYAATIEPVGNAQVEGGDSFNPGNGRSYYGGVSWTW